MRAYLFILGILASVLFMGVTSVAEIPHETSPVVVSTMEVPTIVSLPVKVGFVPLKKRTIDTIVIHSSYNKLGGDVYGIENMLAIFRHYKVSSHYLINREGIVYQLVEDKDLSYHAGVSQMPDGRKSVNRFSIGIELLNTREDRYTEAQYEALQKLIVLLKARHPIKNIVGHGQIAPQRRSDPVNFDWERINVAP